MKTLHNISVDTARFSIKTLGILRHHGISNLGELDDLGAEGRAALAGVTEKVKDEMRELLLDTKYKLLLEYAPKNMDPGFLRMDRKLDMVMDYIERLEFKLTKTHRLLDEVLGQRKVESQPEPVAA